MANRKPRSPVETSTDPTPASTPVFPHLPSLITSVNSIPDHSLSGQSPTSAVTNTAMRRRNSSIISIPSSQLQSTLSRPLPIRPAKVAKTNKESEYVALHCPLRVQTNLPFTSHLQIQGQRPRLSRRDKDRSSRTCRPRSRSPPPQYHVTVLLSQNQRHLQQRQRQKSLQNNLAYKSALGHLETPLVPLVSVTSGQPHPSFPNSLLRYHLLTHAQLDELARFYHQTQPACEDTWRYPAAMEPWVAPDGSGSECLGLETKRCRWGRFIGLRGCESPVTGNGGKRGGEEDLVEKMESDWRRALERREEEERWMEKEWRGRP